MTDTNFDHETAASQTEVPFATVKVEGPGISITRPVNESTMSSIVALLFGAPAASVAGGGAVHQPLGQQSSGAGTSAPKWDPALTLGEFLVETNGRSFAHKICAAGYFLTNIQGAETFDREAVRTALVGAREDMPGNFHRDFTAAASSKLIAEKPGESGQFFVTTTGRRAVESHFADVPRRKAAKRRKPAAASGASGDSE